MEIRINIDRLQWQFFLINSHNKSGPCRIRTILDRLKQTIISLQNNMQSRIRTGVPTTHQSADIWLCIWACCRSACMSVGWEEKETLSLQSASYKKELCNLRHNINLLHILRGKKALINLRMNFYRRYILIDIFESRRLLSRNDTFYFLGQIDLIFDLYIELAPYINFFKHNTNSYHQNRINDQRIYSKHIKRNP